MKIKHIKERLNRLSSNRGVGKEGLSIREVRATQIKQRFTADEGDFITAVASTMDTSRAVLSNALFIEAIIDLLANDQQLCGEVMRRWNYTNGTRLAFFDEIYARSNAKEPIEGEFTRVHEPIQTCSSSART
ncbi:hypothetical protein DI392_00850 [Vibrio albus]|uniref:Uncharacterized protein n=1 Tax=Vibrio albus TaxID=2200953 RepID=A0A2U3BDP5_9VIBR|nr:hypothetical protein [Vibrio albus]PWI34862.1 hypothetical protein DI392_00850 [Vibrio albus]